MDKTTHLPSLITSTPEVPALLDQIRPAWQAKNLINRVKKLLPVDTSSACQRLFNASIHDLREKIIVAGVDIARDAAAQHRLPPISKAEDLEQYPTAKLIDLAYRIGFLSRPEWRKVARCYEIRRDLEHEDDEYEAGIEDCLYIFKTCIEVILSKDPIQLLRVTDLKEVVEEAIPVIPAETLLDDFANAPQPRQEEIIKFLMSYTLDSEQSDIVQQNAYTFLIRLAPSTHSAVKLSIASYFQSKIGRKKIDTRHARVAHAAEIFTYLRQAQRSDFFKTVYKKMRDTGWRWGSNREHGDLLRAFKEIGGIKHCPTPERSRILKWLVQTYLGEPGGVTSWGNVRNVYYSNTAAPIIKEIIHDSRHIICEELQELKKDKDIKKQCRNSHIDRRFETLLDLVEPDEDAT
jgi:hypothetical protein